jgi:hypothetical protein
MSSHLSMIKYIKLNKRWISTYVCSGITNSNIIHRHYVVLLLYGNHCYNTERLGVLPSLVGAIQLCTVSLLLFSDRESFDVRTRVSWDQIIALYVYAVYSLVGSGPPMCVSSAFLTARNRDRTLSAATAPCRRISTCNTQCVLSPNEGTVVGF